MTTLPAVLPAEIAACMVAAGVCGARARGCAGTGGPESPSCGSRVAGAASDASEARLRLPVAQVPPTGTTAAGLSRSHVRCWSVFQGFGGAFPAPDPEMAAEARTETSDPEETA